MRGQQIGSHKISGKFSQLKSIWLHHEISQARNLMQLLKIHTMIWVMALLLSGCAAIDISQYAGNRPVFDLFDYFTGKTYGWGIVQDRKGRLLRQFEVTIEGSIDDSGNLVLDEDFLFSDGEKQKRIWTISKLNQSSYIGRAGDVIGEADGRSAGNVLNWKYDLTLNDDGSTWEIRFDDWMFLQSDGILLNRAEMSKFGFRVGEVTIVFQKILK